MTAVPPRFDRLRLRHLRLIGLIAEHKSLRAIAEVMNLSQPALSQMVNDLEHGFGAALVDRSRRGVSLTEDGLMAQQRARAALSMFDQLADELQAGGAPVLRIGTNPALLLDTFPQVMGLMGAGRSTLRFHIRARTEGVMMQALTEGELDCYVGVVDWNRAELRDAADFRHEPVSETTLAIACSVDHPLARRESLSGRDVQEAAWALPRLGSNNRIKLEAAFRRLGLTPPVPVVEMEADPNAFLTLAASNDFLVCVPVRAAGPHLRSGAIRQIHPRDMAFDPVQVDFVTLAQNAGLAQVQLLRDALIEVSRRRQ